MTPKPAQVSLFTKRRNIVRQSEATTQAAIVRALSLYGLTVLQTSQHRRAVRCCQCGNCWTPAGGMGVSRAIPDLLVTRAVPWRGKPAWTMGVWLGMETKKPVGGKLSPEQKELADLYRIIVVKSADEALAAVREYEEAAV